MMKIDRISATVRYSQDTGKGAWKSLEISAEASINEKEDWREASTTLYGQLTKQFKVLWSANGSTPQDSSEGSEKPVQPSSSQSSPESDPQHPDHYCQEHEVEFKARNGQYGEFFSHQIKGTKQWCNEAKSKN
jgi:hypothetical protein